MSMDDKLSLDDLFERRTTFPDSDARKRFARLVGIDSAKTRLAKVLGVLVHPDGPRQWAKKFHGGAPTLLDYLQRRPPLVVLAGDVGTGKTELAETVGDAVARAEGVEVMLFPISLSTRGSGMVGAMTTLVSTAFDTVIEQTKKANKPGAKASMASILLVDEGDALTQSRDSAQMHHEDRAGVNAFIRGVDRLASSGQPIAIVLCTNRKSAIDPAVMRRAAEIFEFDRPNAEQRAAVLKLPLEEAGFNEKQLAKVVELTGASTKSAVGYTYSDLTQRLMPGAILGAYPDGPLTFDAMVELIKVTPPTPPFGAT